MFDGCTLYNDDRLDDQYLNNISDYIFNQSGYRLKFIFKDHKEEYDKLMLLI